MIYVYGDDGADEKRQRVTAVSVIAGYDDWWEELEAKWVKRCEGIPFHANECESDQGAYKTRSHVENKAMYRDLATLLAESKLGGVAIAIDLAAMQKIFPGSLELAYYRAFLECLTRTADCAQNLGEIAELTFDISTENEYNAAYLYKVMRDDDPVLMEWLHPKISFVSWRESARVQTGDLLAYEGWKALDHTVGTMKRTRGSWELLRSTGRFETFSYSEEWFSDLKRNFPNLRKKLGYGPQDYKQWLEDNNSQHNISNMFRFIALTAKRGK